jgi:hypothetical protein
MKPLKYRRILLFLLVRSDSFKIGSKFFDPSKKNN